MHEGRVTGLDSERITIFCVEWFLCFHCIRICDLRNGRVKWTFLMNKNPNSHSHLSLFHFTGIKLQICTSFHFHSFHCILFIQNVRIWSSLVVFLDSKYYTVKEERFHRISIHFLFLVIQRFMDSKKTW